MSKQLSPIYYPPLVSSQEDSLAVIKKTYAIKGRAREIFFSSALPRLIKTLADTHHLSEEKIAELSRTIRQWFFGALQNDAFATAVGDILGGDISLGRRVLKQIKDLPTEEASPQEAMSPTTGRTERLTLAQARQRFPHIDQQRVTTDPIIIKPEQLSGTRPFAGPLPPTVANWLHIYDQIKGVAKQSAIERADFIYHAPITRGLKESDRTKLAQLLHARDENTPLTIDVDNGRIVWMQRSPVARPAPKNVAQSHTAGQPVTPQASQSKTYSGAGHIPPQKQSLATPQTSQALKTPTPADVMAQGAMGKREKKSFVTSPEKKPIRLRQHIAPIERSSAQTPSQSAKAPSAQSPQGTTQKTAPLQHAQQKPLQQRTPKRATVAQHKTPAKHTITSLDNLRGQKTSPTAVSPQQFHRASSRPTRSLSQKQKPLQSQQQPRVTTHGTPSGMKLPTPQSRTIPGQKKQRAKEKIDRLVRAELPYSANQKAPHKQSVSSQASPQSASQKATTVSFSSGQTMPAEKAPQAKRRFHIAPIKRGM